MSNKSFVHLHLHTSFSLLDGACRVDKLVDAVKEMGMPAVAMTDHGVMYGTIDFYKAAQAAGVKPIVGCEVYITTGSRRDRGEKKAPTHHLVLLAENVEGYYNLVQLASRAQLEGFYYKPRIDKELLAQYSSGLIGLSSCLNGEVTSLLRNGNDSAAREAAGQYSEILGPNNFYLEVQDHGMADQRKVNPKIVKLARSMDLPLVATNDVHYLKSEHAAAHEVLLCMQTQSLMSDPNHMQYPSDQFYLKTREEMEQVFRDLPEALDATLEIAERCNVEIDFDTLHFPTYEVPARTSQRQYLIQLAHEGIAKLYNIADPKNPSDDREREVMERFKQELAVIEKTGFVNYFLVVWDFVSFARKEGIPVGPGRGSGGGSLVAYALGITAIDPLRYSLIFERFLNPERVSAPDFDIDFCQARRGEVIEYVKDKYGRENVAQIITFGSLGSKTVIRDVGRVLEIPFAKCDQLSKMVPEDPKMTLEKALELSPDFKKAYKEDPDCKRILDYGFILEGLYRNPGTHAAGVVIGEKPLIEIIPLARDKDKQPVTQYTMEPLGDLGLLKMDFLGLKTLTVLAEAVELIKEATGEEIDLEGLEFNDEAAYELLNRGDTVGVFQLESSGMRDLIRRIGINRIEDLIAMIALYRPGPMNMLPDYVDRKCGKQKIKYDHPALEPILAETYGVMVYQEQVQQAANVLAGYSLGQADILRRAMGKKKISVMEEQRAKFIAGCNETGLVSEKMAGSIFDNMAKFAGYGFNKAHSAGYGIIAYQTAFLKANYPAEFMSALISSEIGNHDKLPVFVEEAKAMGLEILPPSVNASAARFRPEGKGLRFGLAGMKNVGGAAADAVVRTREESGPFEDLIDFCSRIDSQTVNKKAIESLVRGGAFDGMGMHRARLFNAIDFAMSRAASVARDKQLGQGSLFDLMDEPEQEAAVGDLPDCAEWTESELLAGERELLGIYLSGHPLTQYASILERYQLASVTDLASLDDRTMTRVGGIISSVTKRISKNTNKTIAIVNLEDLDGTVTVLAFSETYENFGMHLQQDAAVLICGEVSKNEGSAEVKASEIYPLADAPRHFTKRVGLHLPVTSMDDDTLGRIREIIRIHPGEIPVCICLQYPGGEKVFVDTDPSFKVLPDDELVHELEHELGESGVFVAVDQSPCKRENNGRGRSYAKTA